MTPPIVCWLMLMLANGNSLIIDAQAVAALETIETEQTEVVLTSGARIVVSEPIADVVKQIESAVCTPRRVQG
jgi:uncharacterized protein YlzI (FlbEa/FlbD family)